MKNFLIVLFTFILEVNLTSQTYSLTITNVSGSNSITCATPSLNFIASNNLSSLASYTWSGPSVLTGSNVIITLPGTYTLTGTSSGMSVSTLLTIGVNTTAPTFSINPSIANITCTNPVASFLILFSPTPTVSTSPPVSNTHSIISPYGGAFVSNSNAAFLYNTSAPGTYTYIFTNNNNGCSTIKQVTVNALPGFPTFSLSSPQNFTLGCSTNSFVVVTVTNAVPTSTPGGPISYTILSPGSPSSANTSSQNSYTLFTQGVFTVNVKDNTSGCVSSVPFSIIQKTLTANNSVVVPSQILYCSTPTVQLQGVSTSTNSSYLWSFPGIPGTLNTSTISITSNTAAPTQSFIANFTLTTTDNNSLCKTTTVVPMYQNIYPPNAKIGNGGINSISCITPSVMFTNISTTGIPPSTGFSTGAPVKTIQWMGPSPQPIGFLSSYSAFTPGVYTLTVKDDNNGCSSSTVSILDDDRLYPLVNNPNGPGVFCLHGSSSITIGPIITSLTTSLIYSWATVGTPTIPGAQSPTLTANALGIYTIVVTNLQSGCSVSAQLTVANCTDNSKVFQRQENFELFPNPSRGTFTFLSQNQSMKRTIEIYNLMGVKVMSQRATLEKVTISLEGQRKGIYFLFLIEDDKSIFQAKVVLE